MLVPNSAFKIYKKKILSMCLFGIMTKNMTGKLVMHHLQDDKAFSQRLKTSPSTPTSVRDSFPTPPSSAPRTISKVPPR